MTAMTLKEQDKAVEEAIEAAKKSLRRALSIPIPSSMSSSKINDGSGKQRRKKSKASTANDTARSRCDNHDDDSYRNSFDDPHGSVWSMQNQVTKGERMVDFSSSCLMLRRDSKTKDPVSDHDSFSSSFTDTDKEDALSSVQSENDTTRQEAIEDTKKMILASTSLTKSEKRFLQSLLEDCVDAKIVNQVSLRLSDSNLFLPPPKDSPPRRRNKEKEAMRDITLQRQLFRAYERSTIRPSFALKRMNDGDAFNHRYSFYHSNHLDTLTKQKLHQDAQQEPSQILEVSANPLLSKSSSVMSSDSVLDFDDGCSLKEDHAGEAHCTTREVVRLASQQSQGFEVGDFTSQDRNGKELLVSITEGGSFVPEDYPPDHEVLHSKLPRRDSGIIRSRLGEEEPDKNESWDMDSLSNAESGAKNNSQPEAFLCDGRGEGVELVRKNKTANRNTITMPLFKMMGTSADDVACHPHVLTPPLMESIQSFMPEALAEHNFWLKYSMARDGASLYKLLRNIRGSFMTVLAIETTEGQVFGSYTSKPWRPQWGYFGCSHDDSFVWKMRRSRLSQSCRSVVDQAIIESELDVYPFTGKNESVQMCRADKIGVGGGELFCGTGNNGRRENSDERSPGDDDHDEEHFGFAIALSSDLRKGSSSTSETFSSPCLMGGNARGKTFRVANVEVWSMTPHDTVKEAERDEMMKLFFEDDGVKNDKQQLSMLEILMGMRGTKD